MPPIILRKLERLFMANGGGFSFVMEKKYLLKAVAYLELKPVNAKMVTKPEDWKDYLK